MASYGSLTNGAHLAYSFCIKFIFPLNPIKKLYNEKQNYKSIFRRILSPVSNQEYTFLETVYALASHQVFCAQSQNY